MDWVRESREEKEGDVSTTEREEVRPHKGNMFVMTKMWVVDLEPKIMVRGCYLDPG